MSASRPKAKRFRAMGLRGGVRVGLLALVLGVSLLGAAPAVASTTQANTAYFEGDARLGPAKLPTGGAVGAELALYRRLGGLSGPAFIRRYWDASANDGKGSWRYPPDNGFVVGPDGKPVESAVDLVPGTDVDRFGSEYGTFLAPAGTPYDERSIPPQSLDTYDSAFPNNYHDYRVVKAFEVEDGPIAPAFSQPGLGIQLMIEPSLITDAPSTINVAWLVQHDYLKALN